MGRKGRSGQPRKKKGGLLMGMRGGFRSAVKGATGAGDAEGKKPSRAAKLFWNVLTVVLALVAGAVLLRRCGVIEL